VQRLEHCRLISEAIDAALVDGDFMYLFSASWYAHWEKWSKSGDPTLFPGPVDSTDLFDDPLMERLRLGLRENSDYKMVAADVWALMVSW
jgi:hypothetical protein